MDYNELVIIKTLIYSSLFRYPLTEEELWQYAISEKEVDKKHFSGRLSMSSQWKKYDRYYVLSGKETDVEIRIKRELVSKKKYILAQKISRILSILPTIQFIGVTGSLSMGNAKEDDDIDLFIITKNKTMWFTRLCVLVLLEILGKRRRKHTFQAKDKICVNFFLEKSNLSLPEKWHNLYTAHEVAQVKPLLNRDSTYEKFLEANKWVETYLPNALEDMFQRYQMGQKNQRIQGNNPFDPSGSFDSFAIISFLNFLAKRFQLWYMKGHRTSEIITDTMLAFYPGDTSKKVLSAYERAIKTI